MMPGSVSSAASAAGAFLVLAALAFQAVPAAAESGPAGIPPSGPVAADTALPPPTTLKEPDPDAGSKGGRFFRPEPGFVRARDLPADFRTVVDSLRFDIKDAFDGADAHSKYERWAFSLLNKLHIESREGTIRRRLLVSEGREATQGTLLESEKALRDEQFLGDAVIEVGPDRGGKRTVKVTTYDQWTTAIVASLQLQQGKPFSLILKGDWDKLLEEEWLYGIGIWESNLLGTGTRLGASYRHELERDVLEGLVSNQSFTRYNLQGSLYAANLSDGHSYQGKLAMPLRSRTDRWAFAAHASSLRLTELLYFDANRLDELPDSLREAKAGKARKQREYEGVTHDSLFLSVTRSYGSRLKLSVTPTFFYQDRYHREDSVLKPDPALDAAASLPPSAEEPWLRTDALLGLELSLYQYDYKTARNVNTLTCNETIETGWRLTARAALNQEWLGAGTSDLWLSQEAAYGQAWMGGWFASCSLSTEYYVAPEGGSLSDGRVDASFEGQWKPVDRHASVLGGSWSSFFATPDSRQLVLGASEGLSGYPSFYYSGQARLLLLGEQRFFPEWELLTFVPAYSLFLAAGNTFPSYSDFDPGDLHYSLGAGIRIGRSKSPTKGMQHISVSWPLGEEGLKGLSVSILSKKSL